MKIQYYALGSLVLLGSPASLQADGGIVKEQKISSLEGGLQNDDPLDDTDQFGFSMASVGDLDNNGVDDLAVGAPSDDDIGEDNGSVYILFLQSDGTTLGWNKLQGGQDTETGLLYGTSLANLGDVDGNGVVDLAVGTSRGFFVVFLAPDGTRLFEQEIADGVGGFSSGTSEDGFGSAVAPLGDLDGDGTPDVLVGAANDDEGGFNHGAVWVLFLNEDGTVKTQQKINEISGGFTGTLGSNHQFGISAAAIGDLDGDSVVDAVVGASGDGDGGFFSGAVWILFLEATGTVKANQKISPLEGGFQGTLDVGDQFGFEVAALGNFDSTEGLDIAVGAPSDDDGIAASGAVWRLFLRTDGTVRSHLKISATTGGLVGPLDNDDVFGWSITTLADMNGDGIEELAVGARGDDSGGLGRGAAYIIFPEPLAGAMLDPTGCDLNPADSLVVTGSPILNSQMSFFIDNPLGSQTVGSIPFLAISELDVGVCGIPIPGWHMDPLEPTGELLAVPVLGEFEAFLSGLPWQGTGMPSEISLTMPQLPSLLGRTFYAQGVLFDPTGGGMTGIPRFALTRGVEMFVGS